MLMNLDKLRKMHVEEKFEELINTYNFDVIDPDQAYINYLCQGQIKYLPYSWNRTPLETVKCDNPYIVHYALGEKPWQNKDVFLGEHFWKYAKESAFYDEILQALNNFDTIAKLKKQKAGIEIQIQALEYAQSKNTFYKVLKDSRQYLD